MADQKKWFKLWCSAPSDDDLQVLSPALRWAWAALGCYTKEHGTKGRVKISQSNAVLAAQMGVTLDALKGVVKLLPHVHIEEGKNHHDEFTVTWDNWVKYQEDSTQAQRQRTSRSKRRGEERRGEERRITPPLSPSWPDPLLLIEKYNTEVCDDLPAVEKVTPARIKKARDYLKLFPDEQFWTEVFKQVNASVFLRGKSNGTGHGSFRGDFDWLLTKGKDGTENVAKVWEGKYS